MNSTGTKATGPGIAKRWCEAAGAVKTQDLPSFHPATARSVFAAFLLISFLSGCSISQKHAAKGSRDRAFIVYWPAPKEDGRLRLAVKDLIDVKGVVTTAGSRYLAKTGSPASSDAECLGLARERNVQIVGKTNLSEFAVAPSGVNDYFGTPKNPFRKKGKRIPGGSSSGSAVAIANGSADVAFGTDTAGSIRVPAACCGIVGLKTTFGLVSLKGVFPIEAKHLDTVGPMGKDVAHTVQGMDLLEDGFASKYKTAIAARPSARHIKIGRLRTAGTNPEIDKAVDDALARGGFQTIDLDDAFKAKWNQAQKDATTVAAAGAWINDDKYAKASGVSIRSKVIIAVGKFEYLTNYKSALKRQAKWQQALRQIFRKVDFIALPTLKKLPPTIQFFERSAILESEVLSMENTAAVNFGGNPALAVPIPLNDKYVPFTSIQLIGPRLSEAKLLNAGRLIEAGHPAIHPQSTTAGSSSDRIQ